jgi:hypothetical protein
MDKTLAEVETQYAELILQIQEADKAHRPYNGQFVDGEDGDLYVVDDAIGTQRADVVLGAIAWRLLHAKEIATEE